MTKLDELRKLAEAADLNMDWIGAGPTRHGDLISTSGKPLFIDSVYLDCDEQDVDGDDYFVCSAGSDEYGRFIAAASPRTVLRLLDDLKAAEQQRDELIAGMFAEEPLRRQIAELRELGRFREKHSLTGSPEIYDDPSAEFHKWACKTHDAQITEIDEMRDEISYHRSDSMKWANKCGELTAALKFLLNAPQDPDAVDNAFAVLKVGAGETANRQEPLQKLAARLADLLDEDQFAECEALLLAAGVKPYNVELTGAAPHGQQTKPQEAKK